jgi:hypothetical protein
VKVVAATEHELRKVGTRRAQQTEISPPLDPLWIIKAGLSSTATRTLAGKLWLLKSYFTTAAA